MDEFTHTSSQCICQFWRCFCTFVFGEEKAGWTIKNIIPTCEWDVEVFFFLAGALSDAISSQSAEQSRNSRCLKFKA